MAIRIKGLQDSDLAGLFFVLTLIITARFSDPIPYYQFVILGWSNFFI
ncbi:hypothetical protein PEDI_46820 [Persicobacter diffluens]|uniref:Uncharacterized protein n=1 Tax=Persicobacter diffluens TaxID=981 RepID=A0AAN4W4V2_9BACT|nr:hypothetical protein PEDI_46820 [Persicobacter diffluens]